MEKIDFTWELKLFVLIFSISRFFFLFIPMTPPEIPKMVITFESALKGEPLSFPSLLQLQLAVFLVLFSNSIVGVRLGFLCYEIGVIIVLYKFTYHFQLREFGKPPKEASQKALIVVYVFSFLPHEIYNYSGGVEIICCFFVISGLYAYYQEKIALAFGLFGVGFLLEIYPILFLIPILVHLLLKKKFIIIVKSCLALIVVVGGGMLPFYFFNPSNFLTNYIIQFSRVPNAVSLWDVVAESSTNWNFISIFNLIAISPLGLTFLIWLGVFIAFCFIYFQKRKEASKREEFLVMIAFFLLLPLVFLSLFPRYVFIALPLLCIFIDSKFVIRRFRRHATRMMLWCIIPISVLTLVFWPSLNFTPPGTEDVGLYLENYLSYVYLWYAFYGIISIIWIKFGILPHTIQRRREYPPTTQLIIFSFSAFILQLFLRFNVPLIEFPIFILGLLFIIWGEYKILKILPMPVNLKKVESNDQQSKFTKYFGLEV